MLILKDGFLLSLLKMGSLVQVGLFNQLPPALAGGFKFNFLAKIFNECLFLES